MRGGSVAEYRRKGYNEEQVELGRMTPEEIGAWIRGWSESGGPQRLGMEVRFDTDGGVTDAPNVSRGEKSLQKTFFNELEIPNYLKVDHGKVEGKIPVEDYKNIRRTSITNPSAGSIMLGKFTPTIENGVADWSKPGPDSYIAKAGQTSTYFNLGSDWGKIQDKFGLTDMEMFEYFNKPALDDAFASGKTIQFSHDPRKTRGFLKKEWEYIKQRLGLTDENLVNIGGIWYVK